MNTHILLCNGALFDYTAPSLNGIDINIFIHHISNINRYAGATYRPYSVAEHSIICGKIAEAYCHRTEIGEDLTQEIVRAALLHDLHEAVITDLPTPLKNAVPFKVFEETIQTAFAKHYGYATTTYYNRENLIKLFDTFALWLEVNHFFPTRVEAFFPTRPVFPISLAGLCHKFDAWVQPGIVADMLIEAVGETARNRV